MVAEGVENQAVLERLAAKGCDVAQGYHFSKPVPAEQFIEWLNQRTEKPGGKKRASGKRR